MLAYLDAGSAGIAATAAAAFGGTVAMMAKGGWRSSVGKLSPKRRKEEEEKAEAAKAAQANLEQE